MSEVRARLGTSTPTWPEPFLGIPIIPPGRPFTPPPQPVDLCITRCIPPVHVMTPLTCASCPSCSLPHRPSRDFPQPSGDGGSQQACHIPPASSPACWNARPGRRKGPAARGTTARAPRSRDTSQGSDRSRSTAPVRPLDVAAELVLGHPQPATDTRRLQLAGLDAPVHGHAGHAQFFGDLADRQPGDTRPRIR